MAEKKERLTARLAETKAVKGALVALGYTGVRVGHSTGTARSWLHIKCDEKSGQSWREKYTDVEQIAQRITGRTGDYGGRINIY